MRFYRMAFNIQEPYHVVVDGTFICHALGEKIHIKEQLPKILDARATPCVTECIVNELRRLKSHRAGGAAIIAKGYYKIKCGHEHPVSAAECVAEQIGESNDRHFVVATQDRDLMVKLRAVPGVPVLRIDGPVPRLEEPSFASRGQATTIEKRKKEVYDWEKSKLPELKAKEVAAAERAAQPQRKRKVKGVNPLSCLKKKGNSTKGKRKAPTALKPAESDEQPKAKRCRSRKMGTRPAGQITDRKSVV